MNGTLKTTWATAANADVAGDIRDAIKKIKSQVGIPPPMYTRVSFKSQHEFDDLMARLGVVKFEAGSMFGDSRLTGLRVVFEPSLPNLTLLP